MALRSDISCILLLACAGGGCTRSADAGGEPLESRQISLREIADECGLAARSLRLNAAGDVRLGLPPGARYEVVDCTLVQLKKRGLAGRMPMGFVGNGTAEEGDGNHASPN